MRGFIVALLAILLVAADTSHDSKQLLLNAEYAEKPAPILWEAARNGSEVAETRLVAWASLNNSEY